MQLSFLIFGIADFGYDLPPTPNSGEENQLQSTQLFKQENYNTSIQQRLIFL